MIQLPRAVLHIRCSGCVKCFGMLGKDFSNGDTINSWWAVSHEV